VVLMRGHGDAVVGQSIKHAVLHAIYAEFNARIEADALRLGGKVTFLNEVEAGKVGAVTDSAVERPWGRRYSNPRPGRQPTCASQ
jgi:ribulose-5-phosphate 4-epimerase/fuculose-1-phosphate aldolase